MTEYSVRDANDKISMPSPSNNDKYVFIIWLLVFFVCSLLECSDYEVRQCPEWAKDGGCERNKDYMKAFCRRSCGLC